MFKETGVGKIDAHREFVQAGVLKALLYNFDFDDFADFKYRELKKQHKDFLRDEVVPLLHDGKGNIWLQASASQIGTDSWNMTLSQNRGSRIVDFLMQNGIQADQIQSNAIGEQDAKLHTLDDERDRSVLLWVYPRFNYDPPPPRHVPPRPKISRNFKIALERDFPEHWKRQHSRLAWGARAARWVLKKLPLGPNDRPFIIVDTTNNLACRYVYVDISFGVTLGLGDSKLDDPHGPWRSFMTEKAIGCWQFGRDARITSINDHDISIDFIHIETPKGMSDVSVSLDTGHRTRGISTSVGLLGDFILMEGPKPFVGP